MRSLWLALPVLLAGLSALSAQMPPPLAPPGTETEAELKVPIPPVSAPDTLVPVRPVGLGLPPDAVVEPVLPSEKSGETNVRFEVDPISGQPYRGYPVTYPAAGRPIAPPRGIPTGAIPTGAIPVEGSKILPVGYPASPVFPGGIDYQTGPCCMDDCCGTSRNPLLENLSFFVGLDSAKEPVDLGFNGNLGYRLAVNWGLPLLEPLGVGFQAGLGYNYERNTMRVLPFFTGVADREQLFTTVGVFQRMASGLNWGLAWDYRCDAYYENIDTSQWRALISLDLGTRDELGVLGTWRNLSDSGNVFGLPVSYRPINQLQFFWRHVWENEIVTKGWIGWAEEHSRFSLFFPGQPHVHHPFVFGGDMFVPLTRSLALFGEANIITPLDSGVITATIGLAWFPGQTARRQAEGRFTPMFNLANNTSFALDVQP